MSSGPLSSIQMSEINVHLDISLSSLFDDTTTLIKMTLLIFTLLIMTILMKLNMGSITFTDITHNINKLNIT
jgi:hypothetical protein